MEFKKTYVNDLDGNILNTPTNFYLEKLQPNGTRKEFAIAGHHFDKNKSEILSDTTVRIAQNPDRDFHDTHTAHGHRGPQGLIKDFKDVLEKGDFAPSFETFKKAFIDGEPYAILTARANSSDLLKKGIGFVMEHSLTKEEIEQFNEVMRNRYGFKGTSKELWQQYLDFNCYIPVSNKEYCNYIGIKDFSINSSDKKVMGMNWYTNYLSKYFQSRGFNTDKNNQTSLGFSDDTKEHIIAMNKYFLKEKQNSNDKNYNGIHYNYRTYYTGSQENYKIIKYDIIRHYMKESVHTPVEINFEEKIYGENKIFKTSFDFNRGA